MTTLLLAALLILGLFLLGQWLAMTAAPPALVAPGLARLGVSWSYLQSLGPEIGGTGIDAVLIGGTTGFVATRLARWRQVDDQNNAIRRRRRRGVAVDLGDMLSQDSGALDLSGLSLGAAKIEDVTLRGTRFSRAGKRPSTLTKIVFEGCEFIAVDFSGCVLSDVVFKNCTLRRCNFAAAVIAKTEGWSLFDGAALRRCRFDGATFSDVDLTGLDHRGCSFWGASFVDSAQMPSDLFVHLAQADCQEITQPDSGVKITSRLDFLSRPTARRWLFAAREMLGWRNPRA